MSPLSYVIISSLYYSWTTTYIMSPISSVWTTTYIMSPLSYLCISTPPITVYQLSIDSNSDRGANIGSEYGRGRRLATAVYLWEMRSKKWMIIIWHSVWMSWDSVDLCRKYTRRTQDGPKRLVIGPRILIRYTLPTHPWGSIVYTIFIAEVCKPNIW